MTANRWMRHGHIWLVLLTIAASSARRTLGSEWTSSGPYQSATLGRVTAVAVDPSDSNTIYCGTAYGALFKSADRGNSWIQQNAHLSVVQALSVDPTDPATIYAGTDRGVFKSVDRGASWRLSREGLESTDVRAVVVDPLNPNNIYVGTGLSGVYRSIDAGGTWDPSSSGIESRLVSFLAIDPVNPAIVYAVAGGDIYKSVDSGSIWARSEAGLETVNVISLAIDPATPNIIFAGTRDRVYKSVDAGLTWTPSISMVEIVLSVVIDPASPGVLYAGTFRKGVYKSTDGGVIWTEGETSVGRVNSLAIDRDDPSNLYAATEGGVWRSLDGGGSWAEEDSGLGTTEVRHLAIHPEDSNFLYAVANGAGVYQRLNDGSDWEARNSGLENHRVGVVAIDSANPDILYAATFGSGVFKSTNGAKSWVKASADLVNHIPLDLLIDPVTPNVVYAGTNDGIYKSVDGGATWPKTMSALNQREIHTLVIHPTNSRVIFAGGDGGVYKSVDGGSTWNPSDSGLQETEVFALAIDPVNPANMYAASLGGGVYKSIDGGARWVASNSGLGDRRVLALAVNPEDPRVLYAGTISGVYRATGGGLRWALWDHGMGSTAVQALTVHHDNSTTRVRAGTIAGVFERQEDSVVGCAHATDLGSALPLSVSGTTAGAADLQFTASCGTGGVDAPEAIYAWTPPSEGTYTIETEGSQFDTLLIVRDGSCAGHELACDDDGGTGVSSRATVTLAANQTIAVVVDGFANASGGFSLRIARRATATPTNPPIATTTVEVPIWTATPTMTPRHNPTPIPTPTTDGTRPRWTLVRDGIGFSTVYAFATDPSNPRILYAASELGNVFKSTNGGGTWEVSETVLGRDEGSLAGADVLSLVIDPTDPNVLYAGTDGSGVYKSIDAGLTWTTSNSGLDADGVSALAIDSANPKILFAGTDRGAVFKSIDGGSNWSEHSLGLEDLLVTALAINPADPRIVYAAARREVYRSVDGGESWVASIVGAGVDYVNALAIDPANPIVVYAGGDRGVYKSVDGGRGWTHSSSGLGDSEDFVFAFALAIDPKTPNTIYAGVEGDVYKSADGARTWASLGLDSWAVGVYALAIDPSDPNNLYAGTTAGIYTTFPFSTPTPAATPVVTPGAFSLYSPADGAWCGPRCCFRWWSASAATSYSLLIEGQPPIDNLAQPQHCMTEEQALPQADVRWTVRACSNSGGCRDASSSVKIDTTPPQAFVLMDPPDVSWKSLNGDGVRLKWEPSADADSGLLRYEVLLDGTPLTAVASDQTEIHIPSWAPPEIRSRFSDGVHLWSIVAVDAALNRRPSTNSRIIRMDSTGPVFPQFTPSPLGAIIADSSPAFSWLPATDQGVGTVRQVFEIDGLSFELGAFDATFVPPITLTEGRHLWSVAAVDALGNTRSTIFGFGYAFTIDKSGPTRLALLSPRDRAAGSLRTPNLCWSAPSDTPAGVSSVWLFINGSVQNVTGTSGDCVTLQPPLPPGDAAYPWYVEAIDRVGNISRSSTWSYIVDTLPPTDFGLVTPCGVTIAEGRPEFSWTESLDFGTGLSGYELTLDGGAGNLCNPCKVPSSRTSFRPPRDLPTGTHTWQVTAIDAVGSVPHKTSSNTCTFNLATTPTPLSSATPSQTRTPSVRPSPPVEPTATATEGIQPTPTAMPHEQRCAGDCDGSRQVTVDELVTVVNIALGNRPVSECPRGDGNGDAAVTVDEIVRAVNDALAGCS